MVCAGVLDSRCVVMEGYDWIVSATRVLWYVPRGNTGLSKQGDPMFPPLCPLKQNLSPCLDGGEGGDMRARVSACVLLHGPGSSLLEVGRCVPDRPTSVLCLCVLFATD